MSGAPPSAAIIPQALATGFSSRLRLEQTSIFISTQPVARTNKRASANAIVNYAEIEEDYDEDEEEATTGPNGTPIPGDKLMERREVKKPASKTKHAVYTPQQMQEIADKEELLIPVRFNMEYDNYKITDFIMWNVNEEVMTPDMFGMITCSDMDLPIGLSSAISNTIKNAISEYTELANIKLPTDTGLHVVIHLSVNLDKQLYEDKFEWDLSSDELSPEAFAKSVVQDMGLSGEFYPAIAHSLHEVLLKMKREAMDGHLPQEVDNQAAFGAEAGRRVDQELVGEEWAPSVETLSPEEIERREVERDRNIRRLKRESAKMGEYSDIGGLFGRNKRRRRLYDGDSPSRGASPAW
ncbi:hypothetical protein TRICI_004095 [Trichomonascus ciferrii]|uniref:Chromatin structure-remodeling complex subunit SFH1 n=1 Tax=Trichomonascus ciferrii TaxID=44093 RepID=A0A642V850_9ASCO|nr:hypothetical protein TRICI_004095 [Trichomonascus ciferrii]